MTTMMATALILFSGTAQLGRGDEPRKEDIKVPNERVEELFGAMREGKYAGDGRFPGLKWEDIPALLELGTSKRALRTFPVNYASSQAEDECPEGMVALWLVEGLRKGRGGFPSLNALCLPEGTTGKWAEESARNQARVLKAYREWWERAKSLPAEEAAEIDPLKETKLRWH